MLKKIQKQAGKFIFKKMIELSYVLPFIVYMIFCLVFVFY